MQSSCAYCRRAAKIDTQTVLCSHKGIQAADASCYRFSYDPLKRVPEPVELVELRSFSDSDFSL